MFFIWFDHLIRLTNNSKFSKIDFYTINLMDELIKFQIQKYNNDSGYHPAQLYHYFNDEGMPNLERS